ncbi:MAG: arginine--tRNA ligase [Euryarchaeota archaeon]|nr:arginine--tRNA ligase [Euryarchaeota archaeon]
MQILKAVVQPLISQALSTMGVENLPLDKMLQPSRELDQGDLALPCFPFSKRLGMPPNDIAEALAKHVAEHPAIGEVNGVNGYLNIRANPQWLVEQLMAIGVQGGDSKKNRAVLIEHTSANPNGPFHVGRARNAILGDTLVRLHRLYGNDVTAEYYVDDMGKQVAVLAWALEHLSEEDVAAQLEGKEPANPVWKGKADHERVRWYQAAQALRQDSENSKEIEEKIGTMVHASEHGDEHVLASFESAYQPVLDGMLTTLGRLGINFDRFTKESIFVTNGDVGRLMERLGTLEINGEADNGAQFLDLGARGLKGKTEFFYRRGDGSSLYATRDIAYHMWKWTMEGDLINVLGEDHKLQAKQVGMTLEELGHKRPEVVFYSFIKLPEGKMSTRRGNVVFMDDLLEEAKEQAAVVVRELRPQYDEEKIATIAEAVGTSAVRFNIIKVSPEKGFTFRWEDALTFEAGSAPFIMYSHTRACSIRRRIESDVGPIDTLLEHGVQSPVDLPDSLVTLLRILSIHHDCLEKAVNDHRPHLFAEHMLRLANSYNAFLNECYILSDGEVNQFYLWISETARSVMHAGMEGLGLVALDEM